MTTPPPQLRIDWKAPAGTPTPFDTEVPTDEQVDFEALCRGVNPKETRGVEKTPAKEQKRRGDLIQLVN
jgi:hypothetical protein